MKVFSINIHVLIFFLILSGIVPINKVNMYYS